MHMMNSVEVQAYLDMFPGETLNDIEPFLPSVLDGLRIGGCSLRGINLNRVDSFRDCVFDGMKTLDLDFAYSDLENCSFRNVTARYFGGFTKKWNMVDASNSYFERTDLSAHEYVDCKFDNVRTKFLTFEAHEHLRCSFRDVRAGVAEFFPHGPRFVSCDFSGCHFRTVYFHDNTQFVDCCFQGMTIDRLYIDSIRNGKAGVRKTKAMFPGAKIRQIAIRNCPRFYPIPHFPRWRVR